MSVYEATENFKNAFGNIGLKELRNSLMVTFDMWETCCANESFDSPGISDMAKRFFMLHDMMAIYYGHWGYLEFEDVRQTLKDHLYKLLNSPKHRIVDFYVQEYARQLSNSLEIKQMAEHGTHVIACEWDKL